MPNSISQKRREVRLPKPSQPNSSNLRNHTMQARGRPTITMETHDMKQRSDDEGIRRIEEELQQHFREEQNKDKTDVLHAPRFSEAGTSKSINLTRFVDKQEEIYTRDLKSKRGSKITEGSSKSSSSGKGERKTLEKTSNIGISTEKQVMEKNLNNDIIGEKTLAEELFSIRLPSGSVDGISSTEPSRVSSTPLSSSENPIARDRVCRRHSVGESEPPVILPTQNRKIGEGHVKISSPMIRSGFDMNATALDNGKGLTREGTKYENGFCSRLMSQFAIRRRLECWAPGLTPKLVYAWDRIANTDDGRGGNGLTGTVLPRLGIHQRGWDIVQLGQRFSVHIVGSHIGKSDSKYGRGIIYSCVMGNGIERNYIHSRREKGYGYCSIGIRQSLIAKGEDLGNEFTISVGMSIGEGKELVNGDLKWYVKGEDEISMISGCSGGMILRFGYYFCLSYGSRERLFASTETPEIVRLVGRRVSDGCIDEWFSNELSYIVIRIATD